MLLWNYSHIELRIYEWMKGMIIAVMKQFKKLHYYMPSPVSGQDEPNLALWLALSRKYTDHALVFFPL